VSSWWGDRGSGGGRVLTHTHRDTETERKERGERKLGGKGVSRGVSCGSVSCGRMTGRGKKIEPIRYICIGI
jgi:hypothetical protein